MENNMNAAALMQKIMICKFVLLETGMFLDTHPANQEALAYFVKYRDLLEQLLKEYTTNYGPITHADFNGGPTWNWIDEPWPWQNREA